MGMCGCLPKSFLDNSNYFHIKNFNKNIFVDENKNNLELLDINK